MEQIKGIMEEIEATRRKLEAIECNRWRGMYEKRQTVWIKHVNTISFYFPLLAPISLIFAYSTANDKYTRSTTSLSRLQIKLKSISVAQLVTGKR